MLESEILSQLEKINKNLEKQHSGLADNFFNGFMRALGSAIGTLFIWVFALLVLSQFSTQIIKSSSKYLEKIMSQINWQKILPKPQIIDIPQNLDLKKLGF